MSIQQILENKIYKLSVLIQWLSNEQWKIAQNHISRKNLDISDQFSYFEGLVIKLITAQILQKATENYKAEVAMTKSKHNRNAFSNANFDSSGNVIMYSPQRLRGLCLEDIEFKLNLIPLNTSNSNPFAGLNNYYEN